MKMSKLPGLIEKPIISLLKDVSNQKTYPIQHLTSKHEMESSFKNFTGNSCLYFVD